jgi:hypothetical protein
MALMAECKRTLPISRNATRLRSSTFKPMTAANGPCAVTILGGDNESYKFVNECGSTHSAMLWLFSANECDWYRASCTTDGTVHHIDHRSQSFEGTDHNVLDLLPDLQPFASEPSDNVFQKELFYEPSAPSWKAAQNLTATYLHPTRYR